MNVMLFKISASRSNNAGLAKGKTEAITDRQALQMALSHRILNKQGSQGQTI